VYSGVAGGRGVASSGLSLDPMEFIAHPVGGGMGGRLGNRDPPGVRVPPHHIGGRGAKAEDDDDDKDLNPLTFGFENHCSAY
jgi:hypothetical protein